MRDSQVYLQNAAINEDNNGRELEIVYSQNKYRSKIHAIGRALDKLDSIAPESITSFKLNEINGGIGMSSIDYSTDRNTVLQKKLILQNFYYRI